VSDIADSVHDQMQVQMGMTNPEDYGQPVNCNLLVPKEWVSEIQQERIRKMREEWHSRRWGDNSE
jgi:hypothetical protein